MSNALKMTLAALGLSALAACTTMPANCPPVIPVLPGVSINGAVVLGPSNQRDLLLYFEQVDRCHDSWAQSTGL